MASEPTRTAEDLAIDRWLAESDRIAALDRAHELREARWRRVSPPVFLLAFAVGVVAALAHRGVLPVWLETPCWWAVGGGWAAWTALFVRGMAVHFRHFAWLRAAHDEAARLLPPRKAEGADDQEGARG
jgi:small-conductance mechanosensitive channel